ncbi:transposase [Streptomyces sp. CA-146814]|uniref:transposase n=1 Tax=Streptomyces sp. CA-146814 TaxID=3240053 RepID=UPI003D8DD3E2
MTPPQAKTWSQRGRTPRGAGSRPFPQTHIHRGADLLQTRSPVPADLPTAPTRRPQESLLARLPGPADRAHPQLGGPIVLVCDNLNVHRAAALREFAASRDWLTIYYLPPYAPDLNPVEGIWALLRRGWLSNVAFSTLEHLVQRI